MLSVGWNATCRVQKQETICVRNALILEIRGGSFRINFSRLLRKGVVGMISRMGSRLSAAKVSGQTIAKAILPDKQTKNKTKT